jgi:class 3 adenylate cyclase/tetratricopeptide (TPR) repeat protein
MASRRCANCGEENASSSRFCSNCGARLDAPATPREERKLVSILFIDLVGFTARSDRADPEDVRETLQLYHAEAKRRIEQYGGVLEKFIGDAVMAVFGAPVAHGDDAERAVRAGLRVLEGIDELNRDHKLDLAARAAVNTGEAIVAVDVAGSGEALATGDVVNTASRLQGAAPAGGLIVGGETYRATRHVISYEQAVPVQAKGKPEAVSAWLAIEPVGAPAERQIARSTLVGRDRELELIRSLWSRSVSERRPHLVTISGPPGMGKSRLCRELSGLVTDTGGRVLRGRCLPYEAQAGYQAFVRIVQEASGILESDPPALAREKLQRGVQEVMPREEVDDALRYLALLLGLAPDDGVPQVLLLFYAARRFLECLGLAQPTLLVFEDIHWAHGSEISLLEYLAQHLRDSPVLVVAAARPELLDAYPTWGSGLSAQTTIPLDPLPSEAAEALATELVASAAADVARLVEVAGGNPLFLEELAASVVELGRDDDLPVTVREAIAARIDAIPAEARSALLSAAVVGKTFWRSVLLALGDREGELEDALRLLEARDFIRRDPSSQIADDVQFTFKHMLIREVAYSTVPRAIRRDRHAAVARYVEEHIAGATETLAAILAYHWREAGEPARAIPYLLAAADAARRGWAHDTVIELYSAALDLADEEPVRRRIRLQRGMALVELADYPRAAEELGELVSELEGSEKLEALFALGHATVWTERDAAETLAVAAEAAALVDELGDDPAVPAVLAMESQAYAMRGGEGDLTRALEIGERALELWVPGTRPLDLRHHLHLHADTTYWVGEYERSIELSRRTRALARDVQSAESLLRGGGLEALGLAGLGSHEQAIAIWDELFEVARELGQNPRVLLNYSALVYRELHDLDEARRRSEQALELSAGEAFGMPLQFAGSDLVLTQLLAGDVGGAQAAWPVRWKGVEQATGWTTWLIAGRLTYARAEIARHAESPESAAEWAARATEIARGTRRRKYEALSQTLFGRALAALGRQEEALAALRSAVATADELVGPPGRWQARSALGEVAYALGRDEDAESAFVEAANLVESFARTLLPERAARLLGAPAVEEILAAAGRTSATGR